MSQRSVVSAYAPLPPLWHTYEVTVPKYAYAALGKEGFAQWQTELRARLAGLLGGFTAPRGAVKPEVVETVHKDGYTQQKVIITSEPGVQMPVYVLTPEKGRAPFRTVIALHGHGAGAQEVIGEPSNEKVAQHIVDCNHDYGRQLAKQGFLVFAPELRGFSERRAQPEIDQGPGVSSCRQASLNAMLMGKTLIGLRVWDIMRVIDYAHQTGLAKTDTIGCVGLSGGGLATTFAAAVDTRITTAVISGYFCTWKWSIMAMRHCECNYIPGILDYAEMADIGALIAPRPLLIEAGTQDPIFPIAGVRDAYDKLAQVYEMLGVPDRLDIDIFEGGHRWSGVKATDWLVKWL